MCANGIAKQQYITGNFFATESSTNDSHSFRGLYRNSYTVQLLSCFYDIAIPRYNVFRCDSVSIQAILPQIFERLAKFIRLIILVWQKVGQ